jgi:hypothetical protein
MAKELSSVRTQLLYRSAAYLLWNHTYGAMVPGLFNGYAVTCFDGEIELRNYVKTYKYSELIKRCVWKVGTAEITEPRLERMFKIKRPLLNFEDIWDRYMIPFNDRLSKYSTDTKSMEAGQCAYMREVVLKKYVDNRDSIAILMLPLVIGFKGKSNHLEEQMSEMLDGAGGEVHNDKAAQKEKERKAGTETVIGLPEQKADKQLKLTPTLKQMGFTVHPDFRRKKEVFTRPVSN